MTQEEKELLLKVLCGRIYYRPKGVLLRTAFDNEEIEVIGYDGHFIDFFRKGDYDQAPIDQVRLYLRPMSSMTEEELKELNDKYDSIAYFFIQEPPYYYGLQAQHEDIGSIKISELSEIYDWLNAHHFDYRGLIEKGLALEAPEGMYKIE